MFSHILLRRVKFNTYFSWKKTALKISYRTVNTNIWRILNNFYKEICFFIGNTFYLFAILKKLGVGGRWRHGNSRKINLDHPTLKLFTEKNVTVLEKFLLKLGRFIRYESIMKPKTSPCQITWQILKISKIDVLL